MKRFFALIVCLLVMNQAHAYNAGLLCVTYLSKNGKLEAHPKEKFTRHDVDLIIRENKKIHPKYNYQIREEKSVYAKGLTGNKNICKALYFDSQAYLQNGVFFIDRAGDSPNEDRYQLSLIVGGGFGYKCRELQSEIDSRDSNELIDFLESNKDLLQSND